MTQVRPMDLNAPYTAPMSASTAPLTIGGGVGCWICFCCLGSGAEAQRGWAGSLGADGSRLEGPFAFCYSKAAMGFTKSPLVKMETDGELLAL